MCAFHLIVVVTLPLLTFLKCQTELRNVFVSFWHIPGLVAAYLKKSTALQDEMCHHHPSFQPCYSIKVIAAADCDCKLIHEVLVDLITVSRPSQIFYNLVSMLQDALVTVNKNVICCLSLHWSYWDFVLHHVK